MSQEQWERMREKARIAYKKLSELEKIADQIRVPSELHQEVRDVLRRVGHLHDVLEKRAQQYRRTGSVG